MPMREGKPPYGEYNGGAHAKQPRGKSTGEHDGPKGHVGTSFKQEAREQSRPTHESGEHRGMVANIPANTEGSELVGCDGVGHAKQPGGTGIGAGTTDIAEHHKPSRMGEAHTFRMPEMREAHVFSGTHKSGHHRVSGHSGAHRIGHRK